MALMFTGVVFINIDSGHWRQDVNFMSLNLFFKPL